MSTSQTNESRNQAWARLTGSEPQAPHEWDLIVIGGGITGAGILREAARRGLSAALVEQRDFAWGTSSRSSKMVHGGLRYLMMGQFRLARQSVRERKRLLHDAPGLVDPLGFLFSEYRGRKPGRWSFMALLSVYDLQAWHWNHWYYPPHEFLLQAPRIRLEGLKGGAQCFDAVTDDARLVFRVIREAQREGALALNYVPADGVLTKRNRVCGIAARDALTGITAEVRAKAVVNATGAWADQLRKQVSGGQDIRPLRGSHLVFPFWRIPVAQSLAFKHPRDGRGVFIVPWEGISLVGSTELDHHKGLNIEPRITPEEVDYLLEAVHFQFPALGIGAGDAISTYSGVRPVIGTGALNPSKEKRDHTIWVEHGLVSVSGGKLTTFRLIALDVLKHVMKSVPSLTVQDSGESVFCEVDKDMLHPAPLDHALARRILGRYGLEALKVVGCAKTGELKRIPGTDTLWAELRWAAVSEAVVHLEDLLLRRTRVGVLVKDGGAAFLDRVRAICREELGWDDKQWQEELKAYSALWKRCYGAPISPAS